MADYIKRSDAMQICENYSQHCFEVSDSRGQDIADRILDDIAEMNIADVEEVVRCKDCIFYEPHGNGKVGICRHSKLKRYLKHNIDFCSYGERSDT